MRSDRRKTVMIKLFLKIDNANTFMLASPGDRTSFLCFASMADATVLFLFLEQQEELCG